MNKLKNLATILKKKARFDQKLRIHPGKPKIGPISVPKICEWRTPNFYFIFEFIKEFYPKIKKKFWGGMPKNFFYGHFTETQKCGQGGPCEKKNSKKKLFVYFSEINKKIFFSKFFLHRVPCPHFCVSVKWP